MPKEIRITVRKHPQLPYTLEVVDNGGIKIPKNDFHTIHWELENASLSTGQFEPVGIAAAGFAWISNPPATAFSAPWVSLGGKVMNIENYFTSGANDWIYMLRVRVGQDIYSTTVPETPPSVSVGKRKQPTLGIRTSNNPIIINR